MAALILTFPVQEKFLPLARKAMEHLLYDEQVAKQKQADLCQVAAEACNLLKYLHQNNKVISLKALATSDKVVIFAEDGADFSTGKRVRQQLSLQKFSPAAKLAYQLLSKLSDEFSIDSGLTGGTRISLTVFLRPSRP